MSKDKEVYMSNPLDISTKYYFWKPFAAYFGAFELKAYRDFVRLPEGLILDLGCSDGTFAQMLKELLGFKKLLIGGDYDGKSLLHAAQRTSVYSQVLRLDASHLPFQKESFDAVLASKILCSIYPSPEQAVREAGRILKKRGIFICTIPTDLTWEHYCIVEFLERIRLPKLANFFRHRIKIRLKLFSAFSPDRWCEILEERGLSVRKVIPFISEATHRRWSILFLTVFRVMGGLRIIPSKRVHCLTATVLKRLMIYSYNRLAVTEPAEYGDYILIISQKSDHFDEALSRVA